LKSTAVNGGGEMDDKIDNRDDTLTRRDFIKTTAGAALAGTAITIGHSTHIDAAEGEKTSIRLSTEFTTSLSASLQKIDFPMTGADVFAKACVEEGLAALFACPGNYGIIHAMANQGIRVVSGRHEGFMAHAADGFIRVSGELAACSGTEGPGFTNMITAIATASKARTPLLVLASNKSILHEDIEIEDQQLSQQPLTEGLKKWGMRIITPSRVYEYASDAFRQLKAGTTGPVHLDFPYEVSTAKFKDSGELVRYMDRSRYRPESKPSPNPASIRAAIDLLRKAERPLIVTGTGVFYHKAIDVMKKFAEKTQIPVLEIGPMRGTFSDGHPLSATLAPLITARKADVVMLVGRHFVGKELGFRPEVKYIRVEPDAENIGRVMPVDIGIVSDEKAALEALYSEAAPLRHEAWVSEVAAYRKMVENRNIETYRIGRSYTEGVHPAVIGKELADFLYRGNIPKEQTVVGVGGYGIQKFLLSTLKAYRPGQVFRPTYGFGTIGADVGMSVGVAAAVKFGSGYQADFKGHPVVCITSDAGFGIDGMEVETLSKYQLPVIVIVYNNDCWGTWADFRAIIKNRRSEQIHLFQEKLRYDKVGEGLGAHGEYVTRPEEFRPALERCYKIAANESLPSVINCQGKKEFYLKDQYPPGLPAIPERG
jgi:thiamine pyrophosphate-dependent acetolactate synthase large subunit-like protein